MPWLHWSIGRWIEGRPADFEACNALACRHPWARDLNPSNVVAMSRGLKVIDYEVIDWPPDAFEPGKARRVARRLWDTIRIARLPGAGESRDIWKTGPLCVKRWSRRVSSTEVRVRCQLSRDVPVCNRMWYVPWLHWTVARWIVGQPATYEACNAVLAAFPGLRDLHPVNVVVRQRSLSRLPPRDCRPNSPLALGASRGLAGWLGGGYRLPWNDCGLAWTPVRCNMASGLAFRRNLFCGMTHQD